MATETTVRSMKFSMPSDTEIVATWTIDAPRELVWAAHTQPEHIRQWLLGPEGWSMPVCEMDLRPGGGWRYVYEGPGGADSFSMSGEIREVQAPRRLVQTEMMNDQPPATLNTLTLDEEDGRTMLRSAVEYPSKEVREEILATGMLDGWAESYERLERYLSSLQ